MLAPFKCALIWPLKAPAYLKPPSTLIQLYVSIVEKMSLSPVSLSVAQATKGRLAIGPTGTPPGLLKSPGVEVSVSLTLVLVTYTPAYDAVLLKVWAYPITRTPWPATT